MHNGLLIVPRDQGEEMSAAVKKASRDGQLNMRIDSQTKALIARAADALGQSQTEFVISTARERALEVIMDRTLFALGPRDWNSLCAALDAPPRANAKLKKLLRSRAPWDDEQRKPQGRKRSAA